MLTLTRWSTAHRRIMIGLWIGLLVASIATAGALKNRYDNSLTLPGTDSQRASALLGARFPALAGDSDQVVFHTTRGGLADPAVRARVDAALSRIARLPHVTRVAGPYTSPGAISATHATGFATVTFDEAANALPKAAVQKVIAVAQSARSPQLQVALGGGAIEQTEEPTLGAATLIGIGAAMVVLFLSFGSLAAMGLPIVTALFGLGTSMGAIAVLTHTVSTPDFASELALLIGLGVGVDYALFVVTRYRDAYRANGGDADAAVMEAMNTAGRSIVFAGATVIIAVLGLFLVGVHIFYGVALAVAVTVALVLLASLTLLPAMIAAGGRRIGGKVEAGSRNGSEGSGIWVRWISAIQRRPAVAAIASTALLLVLAAPVLGLRLASSDAANDPHSTTTYRAYTMLERGFGPGFNGPLFLAVELPPGAPQSGLADLAGAVRRTAGVASVSPPLVSPSGTAAVIKVFPTTSPQSSQTYDLVKHLRSQVIPPVAGATHTTVYVGGFTASQVDFAHVLASKLPLFVGVVIALSALLLLVVFRSLLIPLQAAVMNLLSIGAALGIAQAVFERGWGSGLLGVTRSPIEAFIPAIVFAIVFGLSMDYEVFLVSRIHEEWVHSADHSRAVRLGLIRTGRVITAAAAVMVVVFASFAASDNHLLKLFGLTLASAVLVDAVVIRSTLLPAVLQLFGRSTWAFPRWAARRLPHIAIEPPEQLPGEVALGNSLTTTEGSR
jgi:RND superfamily putative drug exporter